MLSITINTAAWTSDPSGLMSLLLLGGIAAAWLVNEVVDLVGRLSGRP